jgi:hypothetical protein
MDISRKNQEQIAGDNSTQNQVVGTQNNTYVTVAGTSIPDVTEFTTTVSKQVTQQALSLCTQVAYDVALKRMQEFESVWIPRVEHMEKAIDNFADPKFQFMLRDANITAAKSSRKEDLDMLSELLACHIEKGRDIKIDAGINKAINIVNDVDIDTLCALTIIVTILNVNPASGIIKAGLKDLNDLYAKLLKFDLPNDSAWVDNALITGIINLLPGKFYNIEKLMTEILNGYICAGIEINSENYDKAIKILYTNGYSESALVENELLNGYYRLKTSSLSILKPELKPIIELYSKDVNLLNQVGVKFMEIWNSYEILNKIRVWFENLDVYFRINTIGRVLAQTNAKRCCPEFPDII